MIDKYQTIQYYTICSKITTWLPCEILKNGEYSKHFKCTKCWRNIIWLPDLTFNEPDDGLFTWEDYET